MSGENWPPRTVDQVFSLAVRRPYFYSPGDLYFPLHKRWRMGHIRRGLTRWAGGPAFELSGGTTITRRDRLGF